MQYELLEDGAGVYCTTCMRKCFAETGSSARYWMTNHICSEEDLAQQIVISNGE